MAVQLETYRDEGCDLFASCLTCPLHRCRYELPNRLPESLVHAALVAQAVVAAPPRSTLEDAVRLARVNRRTAYRALREAERYGYRTQDLLRVARRLRPTSRLAVEAGDAA